MCLERIKGSQGCGPLFVTFVKTVTKNIRYHPSDNPALLPDKGRLLRNKAGLYAHREFIYLTQRSSSARLLPKGRKKARKSQKIFRFAHPVRSCAGGTFFYFLYFCGTFHYSLLTSSKSLTLGIARIHSALLSLNRDFHFSLSFQVLVRLKWPI